MSEWISVDDNTVEPKGEVLCIDVKGDYLVGYLSEDYTRCECNGVFLLHVTHWMELPVDHPNHKREQ